MLKYLVGFAFLATAFAQTPVTECSATTPLPDNVDFNGCTEAPCPIPHGDTVKLNITFTAPRDLEVLHIEVFANALGIEIPIPLLDSNVCNGLLEGECPVAAGSTITFHNEVPILDILPQIDVGLSFLIVENVGGDAINCAHVSCSIV